MTGVLYKLTDVHVAPVPKITVPPLPPNAVEAAHVRTLIRQLATLSNSSAVMVNANSETWFDPKPVPDEFLVNAAERKNIDANTFAPMKELVSLGPRAIPFLLDALDDKTPTGVKIGEANEPPVLPSSVALPSNPGNVRETRLLADLAKTDNASARPAVFLHRVTVGDLCFVALGQIVRRGYRPVQVEGGNSIVVTSPTSDPALARCVRAIWSSPNPVQLLMDSLLCDLTTSDPNPFDGMYCGINEKFSDPVQLNAAIRLAYYFPHQIAPLFVARIKAMSENSSWSPTEAMIRMQYLEIPNQVPDDDFLMVAHLNSDPRVQAVLRALSSGQN